KVLDIVKRFGIAPPQVPSLVPIGGVQTSPMKLTQSYGSLANNGVLPQARFLVEAIGSRGNVIGFPVSTQGRRVMSPEIASSVLQALRAPVRDGTARAANSSHALVFGKTGTSSHNEDALFVGVTRDFVGCIWLGHDRPTPMPGVHGGGTPASTFSKLTDFYYVRLAQAGLSKDDDNFEFPSWSTLHALGAKLPGIIALACLGLVLLTSFLFRSGGRKSSRTASRILQNDAQQNFQRRKGTNQI